MPDLAVHVCAGLLGSKFLRDPAGRALFVAGNCLPDLASKTMDLGFVSPPAFSEATHTPFGILCLAYAAAMLFEEGWRQRAFLLLAAGSSHALPPATTTISDIVYRSDSSPASGVLLIAWPAFNSFDGESVAAGNSASPSAPPAPSVSASCP